MPEIEDDVFTPIELSDLVNKRKAVRYVRKDITATIKVRRFFKSSNILVALIDISSKGALIHCNENLNKGKSVTLILNFNNGRKFQVPSTVVHSQRAIEKNFGLKFDCVNNTLAEYLLQTQTDLILK